jgi:hypothetical protein
MSMSKPPLRAPWLQAIAYVFGEYPVYAVGGAVRNTLMGLPVSDVDLCGAARPGEVQACCEGTNVTARLRAAHFGTVELHTGGHMAEYTTFRQDSYRGGHQPFAVRFADSLEEDALRRDFSVNALYAPLDRPDEVIDPAGGLSHLEARILHTVTPDPDQVLKDDGLRILRAARFTAELNFTPTEALLRSARKHAGLLNEIAPERKRDELTRLLMADTKYPTLSRIVPPVSAGLAALVNTGAWPRVFGGLHPIALPAMDRTETLSVGGKLALLYHRETLDALLNAMLALRYAKREAKLAAEALSVFKSLERGGAPTDVLQFGLPALQTALKMLSALAAFDVAFADTLSKAERLLLQAQSGQLPTSLRQLAIGGEDLNTLCDELRVPRDRIGVTLNTLWQEAVNVELPNTREALLARARALLH